jgi:alpha-beta hydrolase superfamily lysophospholipase
MRHTTRTWKNQDGLNMFSQTWLPQDDPKQVKNAVVLIHGLGEHSDRYASWAKRFTQIGIAVHAIDLQGHGRSDGKRGHTTSMGAIYDDVKFMMSRCQEDHPQAKLHLYGHSMGGALAIGYAALRADDARAARLSSIVLSGPAFKPGFEPPAWKIKLAGILERLWPSLTLPNGLDPEWLSSDPAVVFAYKSDPLVHNLISVRWYNDWTRAVTAVETNASNLEFPVLIMHGGEDKATCPIASEKLAKVLHAQFKLFAGMRHELHNEACSDEVFRTTMSVINSTG